MKVHLVDGTYELFRAFFGAPESKSPDGREVGATHALLRMFRSLVDRHRATHVAIAFDYVIESFRNDLFDGYKTGAGLPVELTGQFRLAERAAAALGFVVWPMVEFEADDALAAGAAKFAELPEVEQVVLCTPDKDMAQCVRGDRVVCFDRFRGITMNEPGVHEKFGIGPESIPDYLGLVGDDADGIPGIPRWGAKSAGQVLAKWKKLESIPDDPAKWDVPVRGAAVLAQNLRERRVDALLYRKLATLRTDAPLGEDLGDLQWRGPNEEALADLRREIGDPPPG